MSDTLKTLMVHSILSVTLVRLIVTVNYKVLSFKHLDVIIDSDLKSSERIQINNK